MGLCKCRTVTNLFCFQHRKNVCEKCIITDHPKCVVRSYLQWLQDSDYEPLCQLCKGSLDQGELVRLTCLDLFHTNCVNDACNQLPNTTAPAGYMCATCQTPIIPPDNVNSPLAEIIRSKFQDAKWAQHILPRKPLPSAAAEPTLDGHKHDDADANGKPPPIVTQFDSGAGAAAVIPMGSAGPTTGIPETLPRKAAARENKDADDDKYGKGGRGEPGMLGTLLSDLKPRRIGYRKALIYLLVAVIVVGVVLASMYQTEE
ncbi:hypothetical protein DFJ74DRAFT_701786 [Hyaloraphidium curvatum]|nr:hypothetical protein DFJ74DRAFT_701786 [Hyaloraphidium curvatum]